MIIMQLSTIRKQYMDSMKASGNDSVTLVTGKTVEMSEYLNMVKNSNASWLIEEIGYHLTTWD